MIRVGIIGYGKVADKHVANGRRNIGRFLRIDFHAESGMHFLISSFNKSLTHQSPLPIPYKDILLTSRIMDDVFGQIKSGTANVSIE